MLPFSNRLTPLFLLLVLFLTEYPLDAQTKKKGISEDNNRRKEEGNKFAFVIGINNYNDPNIGNLDKAENDAAGVAKVLLKYGNFKQIQTIGQSPQSQSKYEIEAEFDRMLDEMESGDSLVFYFSGHGMTDYDEKNYLLTSDSSLKSIIGTSISVDDLLARTRAKGLKKVLFILDACRNPDKTTQLIGPKFLSNVSFSDVDQVAVFYSTKLGYFSYEDDKSAYGVFTKYLIYGMEGRADSNFNAEITFTELSDYVTNALKDWSSENKKNQKPYVKYFGEKSDDQIITHASNPEFSIADLKINDPYSSRYLLQSLAFPGWGQYSRGETTKGKYMMWGSGFLYGLMTYSYFHLQETKREYLETPGLPPSSQLLETYLINETLIARPREEYQSAIKQMETVGNLFLIYQVYNIIDFYFLKRDPTERMIGATFSRERILSSSANLIEDKTYVFFQTSF
ncbi:caspase family protein [Leptospira ognonensis]|uniref:Caspase family protein n=1 Tax=Leptospira ognonensis TaxID=2484945 RepID=A0A4V6QM71_9LEPT|nr:caspase family protein [Leptospira ognonensis]TGL61205.1 caspase family protein [Leptospira ognonensis]